MNVETLTIPPVPKLAGDIRCGGLAADAIVERHLAWALLHYMQQAYGGKPLCIDDGDGKRVPVNDLEHAMDLIFDVDESSMHCGDAWVFLICGNGVDFISDYGVSPTTEQAIQAAERHVGTRL
jgi:hypothetical protein